MFVVLCCYFAERDREGLLLLPVLRFVSLVSGWLNGKMSRDIRPIVNATAHAPRTLAMTINCVVVIGSIMVVF